MNSDGIGSIDEIKKLRHDVNSFLTTIRGNLELVLLKDRLLSEKSKKRLKKAIEACDNIESVIEQCKGGV